MKAQVKDAYTGSTAIFSGTVISVTAESEFDLTVKLKVDKYWKGRLPRVITITTAKDSAMCGYQFETGKKYLVYTNGPRQELMTGLCTRTALAAGNGDTKFLDKLKKPVKVK